MVNKDIESLIENLEDVPAEYLPAYEYEHMEIESPYVNMFNECLDRYFTEHLDSCTEITDIYWYITEDSKISFNVSYEYDCEEFPYDQTDVDEFKTYHMKFTDTYNKTLDLKDKNIAAIIKEIEKGLRSHIEFEVESKAKDYANYDPCDEYVHPDERYPNDRW